MALIDAACTVETLELFLELFHGLAANRVFGHVNAKGFHNGLIVLVLGGGVALHANTEAVAGAEENSKEAADMCRVSLSRLYVNLRSLMHVFERLFLKIVSLSRFRNVSERCLTSEGTGVGILHRAATKLRLPFRDRAGKREGRNVNLKAAED